MKYLKLECKVNIEVLSDSNEIWTHNHSVRKRILNYFAKL